MNTKLLNKVANAILDEPRKFDMSAWVQGDDRSPCGTTACIAGHAAAIAGKYSTLRDLRADEDSDRIDIEEAAHKALRCDNSIRLFFLSFWPLDFAKAYRYSLHNEERVEIVFWRIQHFIATEGRE